MKELCAQVKELTGVVLEPRSCDPYQLREDVEQRKNYDLAYYHYDFPDESYWLAPLFGPPPGREDDTNIFKYHNVELTKLLDGTKNFRDFAKVQEHQRLIHGFLNREMPFIPLWQLDPLLAYRNEVKPSAMDPLLLFGNIEEWRLQHK
jgi:ABC-type oligopeptide transport system substrate-binding subunit